MDVTVLLFGQQARLAGTREVTASLASAEPTVAEVLGAIGEAAPELRSSLAASRLAINHAFAAPEQVVSQDDEVALIGMVSGG